MLYFVTGNTEKALAAKKQLASFNIQIEIKPLELTEIQSDSIEVIARDKAEKAYSILQKPLIISDHGWAIPGLNGFPGPYMKYINQWLTSDDFLRLTKDLPDRRIILSDVLCYIDAEEIKVFQTEFVGELLHSIKGEGLPTMRVVTMTDDQKSVAQYISEGKDPYTNNPNWGNLATFLSEKN